jgi:hypothetical protein
MNPDDLPTDGERDVDVMTIPRTPHTMKTTPSPSTLLEYFLADHPEARIFTTAPIHAGDVVVTEPAGSRLERIVARTEFAAYPGQTDTRIFAAFVYFEKEAERVGGVGARGDR